MVSVGRTVVAAAVGVVMAACSAAAPPAPRSGILEQPTVLDGAWAGAGDTPFWYSVTLHQSGESITGSGTRGPRPASGMMFPSVLTGYRGTFRARLVDLTIEVQVGQPLRFVGELESSSVLRGTLSDATGAEHRMFFRRQ